MQDLYSRIAGTAELSQDSARDAVGHILAFMKAESDDPAVDRMIAETPGATQALTAVDGSDASGGIMALGAKLMSLGMDLQQIRAVAEELVAFSKAHAGDDTVEQAIASVPALTQFV